MADLLQDPEPLLEYSNSRGIAVDVDRELGILRGIKLIGLESRNGRRYQESALSNARTLYEEAKVNVNHPKDGPLSPRDYQDRLGVIRGVELRSGKGLFGNLHFNPKHALSEQLLWDAEHNPHNVGFSHNVLARLSRDGETTVVEEITKVQSVDLVADPATTRGLFEQVAASVAEVSSYDPAWGTLTSEILRLHRPDLFVEIESQVSQQLQTKLEEVEQFSASLVKKQQIYELLCRHELSIAGKDSPVSEVTGRSVSPLFVELLMEVADDKQLEALVAERAELIRQSSAKQHEYSVPRSRDQSRVYSNSLVAFASAQDFAVALKSSRN